MTPAKAPTQQPQLHMFVLHVPQPPYLCSLCDLVYIILVVGTLQYSCTNPNILKSYYLWFGHYGIRICGVAQPISFFIQWITQAFAHFPHAFDWSKVFFLGDKTWDFHVHCFLQLSQYKNTRVVCACFSLLIAHLPCLIYLIKTCSRKFHNQH